MSAAKGPSAEGCWDDYDSYVDSVDLDALERQVAAAKAATSTAPPHLQQSGGEGGLGRDLAPSDAGGTAEEPTWVTSGMLDAARRLSEKHAAPSTLDELQRCIQGFQAAAPHLPPPPPPSLKCPGVYAKGCSGCLEWIEVFEGNPYWVCSRGREIPAGCSYRLYPPKRLLHPQLDLMVVAPGVLEVARHLGAEQAVAACGGVAAVLRAAGADLSRALPCAGAGKADARLPVDAVTAGAGCAANTAASRAASAADFGSSDDAAAAPLGLAAITQPSGGVRFPLSYYQPLRKLLQAVRKLIGFELLPKEGEIPGGTLAAFLSPEGGRQSADEVEARYAAMPPFLEAALLPFQREGVRFGLERDGRCLIGDEMGVGKTVQAIALAACYRSDGWPLLVVAPASLRLVWAEEVEKWLPDVPPASIHLIFDKHDRPEGGALPPVTVTSYKMLEHLTCRACKKNKEWREKEAPQLRHLNEGVGCRAPSTCAAALGWRMVIVDESHNLRTTGHAADAQHTEALRAVAQRGQRVVMLTGTPSLSKPFDLWNQVSILRPTLLSPDRFAFAAAYCHRRLLPFVAGNGAQGQRWDQSGLTRAPELHLLLRQEVMVRRLKRDVLTQLPPKRRQVIRLPKPTAEEWPKRPGKARCRADASDASSGEDDGEVEQRGGAAAGAAAARAAAGAGDAPEARSSGAADQSAAPSGSGRGTGERAVVGSVDPSPPRPGTSAPPLPPGWAQITQPPASRMSAAHRTGLAKCSAAIEWLNTQLGLEYDEPDPAGGCGQADADEAEAAQDATADGAKDEETAPKFIVFAHHRDVMNKLAYALDVKLSGVGRRRGAGQKRYDFVRIDGETDGEGRRRAVERFRSDARVRVALLSVTAAGVGLDFSAAAAVVFVELPAEVSLVRQAEDRAHRQGQQRQVNVYFLCARGTCDERHWQRLSASLARVGAVVDGAGGGAAAQSGHDAPGANGGGAAALGEAAGLLVDEVLTVGGASQWQQPDAAAAPRQRPPPPPPTAECPAAAAPAEGPGTEAATQPQPGGGPGTETAAVPAAAAAATAVGGKAEGGRAAPQAGGGTGASAPPPAEVIEIVDLTSEHAVVDLTSDSPEAAAAMPAPRAAAASAAVPPAAGSTAGDGGAAEADPGRWWFEVSANTQRVHFHAAQDRSAPLRLSLPLEALLAPAAPAATELLSVVQRQLEHRRRAAGSTAAPAAVVGGVGPVAVDLGIVTSVQLLRGAVAAARAFAAEWRELSAAPRSRLTCRPLQPPLEDSVDAVTRAAAAEGALGAGTDRFLTAARPDLKLPEGAEWRDVVVRLAAHGRQHTYAQPVLPSGARLCLHCAKEVPGRGAADPAAAALEEPLESACLLFCGAACERRYAVKSSAGAGRRALYRRERGVCRVCGVDAAGMVQRLQAVERGSRRWRENRLALLQSAYPSFAGRLSAKTLAALVAQATPGRAWQADHVIPVYLGGGQCDVDNLRTLCTPCHAEVTAKQAAQRRAGRAAARAGGDAAPCARRRPAKRARECIEESEDEGAGARRGRAAAGGKRRAKGGNGK